MGNKKKLDLLALASTPLTMTLGNSMLIPVLPLIKEKLDVTSLQVSLIITIYSVVAIILIPIAGYLSDQIGRKKVIIPSLLIAGIGGIITGWASWKLESPYVWILVGRAIQGIGSAGAMPVVLPCVSDMFKDEKEISAGLGLIETANTFGKVLSPIIGSLLAAVVWFLPFWFIPIFSFTSVILIIFFVKVPKTKPKKQKIKAFVKTVKKTLRKNLAWLCATFTLGMIVMFVLFGTLFYFSETLESLYSIDGIKKGFVMAFPLLILSIASYLAGKKIGQNCTLMKWFIVGSFCFICGGFSLLFLGKSLLIFITSLSIAGIGVGASLPCLDALITENIEKAERGTISSFYSSARFIGVAAGPPIYTLLMTMSDLTVIYTSCILGGIGVLISLFFIHPDQKEKTTMNGLKYKFWRS